MGVNVLIVEDDMDVRNFLKLEISQEHQVTEFRHGKTAWEYLEEGNRPDIIITDLVMPRMDGMTLVSKIKGTEWGSNIPVLILTGVTSNDDVPAHVWKEATEADEFLEKPLEAGELLSVIAKWIDRYKNRSSTETIIEEGDNENDDTEVDEEDSDEVKNGKSKQQELVDQEDE